MPPASTRHPIIVASNRGPVSFRKADRGELTARRGGGGLVTALGGLARDHDVTWVSHAMTDGDVTAMESADPEGLAESSRDGFPYRLKFVGAPDNDYREYYATIANPLLWFVQHRMYGFGDAPTITRATHRAWGSYERVNRRLADSIVEVEQGHESESPWLFVHDYQLMLVPGMVKAAGVTSPMLYFHHVPWPDDGALRCLPRPWLTQILESLFACDIIGLQTERDVDRLLHTFQRLEHVEVDYDRREIRADGHVACVRAYPISVAADEFAEHVNRSSIARLRSRIAALRPPDGALVVRVDRTDPSKNIVRGFQAWALLLHEHPELHGKVTMFCQLDPSRQEVSEYSHYLRRLMAEAGTINATWGSGSWQPLVLNTDPDFLAAVAAYCEYDVPYVNPIADGMNLVSKEGPLVNQRDGVVVLSEQAGSFHQLQQHVVRVNPFDVADQADALLGAIRMSATERHDRAVALREHVQSNDIRRWINDQLRDLAEIS